METLEQRIEKLKKEFDEKIQALRESSKHEFAKGWNYVKTENYTYLALNPEIKSDMVCRKISINLQHYCAYTDDAALCCLDELKSHRPATPSEIKDALVKVCEKMGIVPGAKIKQSVAFLNNIGCPATASFGDKIEKLTSKIASKYNHEADEFTIDGWVVYSKGMFAELVKEEEIKIGGYEVKFTAGHSPWNYGTTHIDGNEFSVDFWRAAKIISEHSKAKIMIGCSCQFEVSLEIINKILRKLNG